MFEELKVASEITNRYRYHDSAIYEFKILVNNIPVQEDSLIEEEPPQDKIFKIQVQDGYNPSLAMREFLTIYKNSISAPEPLFLDNEEV